jgi:hypothetical protein
MFKIFVLAWRRFILSKKKYSSVWEYDESAYLDNAIDNFYLLPATPKSQGYSWFSQSFPSESWFASFTFTFASESGSSQVGISVIKDFGPFGPVFSDQLQFARVALLCLFSNHIIESELRGNDGKGPFVSYMFSHFFQCLEVSIW